MLISETPQSSACAGGATTTPAARHNIEQRARTSGRADRIEGE
jgi:hypothetical protein